MTDNKIVKMLLWILLICFYIGINIIFGAFIKGLNIKNDVLLNSCYIAADIFITAILLFLYKNDFKNKFKELKSEDGNQKIIKSIKAWLIGLAIMVFLNIIIGFFVGDIASNEAANRSIISGYSIYAIISMIILAPICEEIIFRLSISKMIDNKFIFILFSGLIFGFAHVMGTKGMQMLFIFPYTALGISFAYIYQKYKNIFLSILMHIIHNMICLILIFCI